MERVRERGGKKISFHFGVTFRLFLRVGERRARTKRGASPVGEVSCGSLELSDLITESEEEIYWRGKPMRRRRGIGLYFTSFSSDILRIFLLTDWRTS